MQQPQTVKMGLGLQQREALVILCGEAGKGREATSIAYGKWIVID